MAYQHDYNELLASISSIVSDGAVFEIRCLTQSKQVDAGYFDKPEYAANALLDLGGYYTGIYITPNPLNDALLARSFNRMTKWAQNTTHDDDVIRRAWLLIDFDAIRPKGISSSDTEHQAALDKAGQVAGLLSLVYGWPQPMLNSSGNGAHLMYPIDEPNTEAVRDEIAKFLKILRAKYSDAQVDVDAVNYNAARIWRLPATFARKGDVTPDRPHRKATILRHVLHNEKVTILDVARFNEKNHHLLGAYQSPAAVANKNRQEYPDDEKVFKLLNEHAMRRIKEWAPHYFPTARPYKEGFRVASEDLGLDFEEDLTIHPWPLGIKYFGFADQGDSTEGRRTPIGLIAEFVTDGDKAQAARSLSDFLKAPMSEFDAIPAPVALNASHGGMAGLMGTALKRTYGFQSIRSVADLQKQTFKEMTWVVPNMIPTGNIMLAARPKMRKTWLALQLGIAIAAGRPFMGYETNKGDVLALLLEDNERRLQNRIKTLQQWDMFPPDLSGFRYWTGGIGENGKLTNPEEEETLLENFPRGPAGVDALEQYLEKFPNTSTIIIDTFAHFRDNSGNNRDVYQRDYDSMVPITRLAARKNVLIIPVHHEKKGLANSTSGDFMEDVNGSSGITGGVDGVMSIKGRRGVQDENESRKLYISGRDIPHDYELDISFDAATGGWKTAARMDVRTAVIDLLMKHPFINQKELSSLLPNVSLPRLTKVLMDMKFTQEIVQDKFGYSLKRG